MNLKHKETHNKMRYNDTSGRKMEKEEKFLTWLLVGN